MEHSDYVIFVDESGDHGLTSIDDNYPIFVLDFCIFEKDHYVNVVVPTPFLKSTANTTESPIWWLSEEEGVRMTSLNSFSVESAMAKTAGAGELGLELVFADKKANSSGLQLADLTARPIGRHVLNPEQRNRAWEIIEQKFRRSTSGKVDGWGLKVFP